MPRKKDGDKDNLKTFDNEPQRNFHKNKKATETTKEAEEAAKAVLEVDEVTKATKHVKEVKNTKAIVDLPQPVAMKENTDLVLIEFARPSLANMTQAIVKLAIIRNFKLKQNIV